jgi:hypothetical protein
VPGTSSVQRPAATQSPTPAAIVAAGPAGVKQQPPAQRQQTAVQQQPPVQQQPGQQRSPQQQQAAQFSAQAQAGGQQQQQQKGKPTLNKQQKGKRQHRPVSAGRHLGVRQAQWCSAASPHNPA